MSEQIREQISAFLDGELPNSETELLLKRLTRDAELRESFGRYALIGESLRGGGSGRLSHGFTSRVNRAIDGEPVVVAHPQIPSPGAPHWWRPLAGAAVAAGVAVVAVLALQQRADAPTMRAGLPATAQTVDAGKPKEALSYTVPATLAEAPAALPAARLTNYVFAHSKYSSVLGQSNVLSGLLEETEQQDADAAAANSRAVSDAAVHQSQPPDPRVAP
jgi:sigma-E factor negative regulatory protein RseA